MTRSRRSVWYAAAGAVAVCAPTGVLLVRELYAPRPIATELSSQRLTYSYVLVATAIELAFLRFLLGR